MGSEAPQQHGVVGGRDNVSMAPHSREGGNPAGSHGYVVTRITSPSPGFPPEHGADLQPFEKSRMASSQAFSLGWYENAPLALLSCLSERPMTFWRANGLATYQHGPTAHERGAIQFTRAESPLHIQLHLLDLSRRFWSFCRVVVTEQRPKNSCHEDAWVEMNTENTNMPVIDRRDLYVRQECLTS